MSTELTVVESKTNPLMALQSWEELLSRAEFFAKSQLIPAPLRSKPADVAIILQYGVELGIPPLQALNGIDVVQGKPTVSPQLATALIRQRIPNAYIKTELDESKLVARVTMARDRNRVDEGYTSTWDMGKAQKMGLTGKDNYQKQPMNMLKWRATMDAARTVFPDIIKGLDYMGDEVEDFSGPTEGEKKAAAITAQLHASDTAKEVQSEVAPVVAIKPKEPEVIASSEPFDPLADYEVQIGDFRGKRLKSIEKKVLAEGVLKVKKHFDDLKKPMTAKWLEFVTRAEQYLEQPAEEETISFENFS